jgi:hypothetical protein
VTNLLSFYFVKKAMLKCADFWLSVRQMLMQKTKGTIPPHTPRYLSTPAIFDFLFASDILAVANLRCIAGLNRAMSKCADFSLSAKRTWMQKMPGAMAYSIHPVSKITSNQTENRFLMCNPSSFSPVSNFLLQFWTVSSALVVWKRSCRNVPISRWV